MKDNLKDNFIGNSKMKGYFMAPEPLQKKKRKTHSLQALMLDCGVKVTQSKRGEAFLPGDEDIEKFFILHVRRRYCMYYILVNTTLLCILS